MYIWGFSRLKRGPRNEKKMLNSAKGLISQRRRVEKKNDISFSFYIEKKTFTANFAQSAENNADPVFIKSGIYIYI